MIYRALTPGEWWKVKDIFLKEFQENPPSLEAALIVVAEEGGEIVALLTCQSVIHMEPLWVKKGFRGKYIVPRLVKKMYELIPSLQYCFAYVKEPRLGALLEKFGMKKMGEWVTYRWIKEQ